MTAFLHRQEPEDGRFDALPYGEETVVLEEGGLLVPKAGRNVFAFLLGKDDTVEGFVQNVVLEKPSQRIRAA